MIKLKSIINENNTRINTFKRELKDFIKKWRESDHPHDKARWMEMIKLAKGEIEKEKKKTPEQREYEFDKREFLKHHHTGHIASNAYERSEAEGGLSWMGDVSKWPELLDRGTYGPFEVEFRQRNEKNEYVAQDKNGNIIRDERGNAVYMTDDEKRAKNLPLRDTTIAAFVNGKPVGLASNEFGAVGVWVERPYQRHGIGVDLLDKHIEQRPDVKSGRAKIGQMTNAGLSMTSKYYDKLTKQRGPGWFAKWKQTNKITESIKNPELEVKVKQLQDSLIKKYPQLDDLYLYLSADGTLYVSSIRIKLENRHVGVGSSVMEDIKKFADKYKLTITLSPEPEKKRYTKKLDRFYSKLGFVDNRGRNKDYRIGGCFGRTMYRRPRIDEGAILIHKKDKNTIDNYINDMRRKITPIIKYDHVTPTNIAKFFQSDSDNSKYNKFPFHIKYLNTNQINNKRNIRGVFSKDDNTIYINIPLLCKWKLDSSGYSQVHICDNVRFDELKEVFLHEFVHYIQDVYRKEKSGEYTIHPNWNDEKNYYKQGWEQQAHGIDYLQRLKQKLNTESPEELLTHLKRVGLSYNKDLDKLKKTDYKAWKAIMKQAIITTIADIKEK